MFINSKVEKLWTIIIAVFMLIAAGAYAITISTFVVWDQCSVEDILWIISPIIMLGGYAIVLLFFCDQRGVRVNYTKESSYQGAKYPWL